MNEVYGEPPLDEEEMGKSLVPMRTLPPINVDQAIAEWNDYQRLCREILNDEDYAIIGDRKARKRSGWAKLRRFYNISTRITWEERVPPLREWEPGQSFMYLFTVSGQIGNRVEFADGTCESEELEHIAPTEHNCRSKALTRALNRLTSNLIGGGEVSAEELETAEAPKPTKAKRANAKTAAVREIQEEVNAQLEAMELKSPYTSRPKTIQGIRRAGHKESVDYLGKHFADVVGDLIEMAKAPPEADHWIEDDKTRKKFWADAKNSLGLTEEDVYEALGVKRIRDFEGSPEDARTLLENYIEEELA